MEVILCKDVPNLGKAGAVVKVKEGHARNFLFPQKVAYPATATNVKRIEQQKAQQAVVEQNAKKEAEDLSQKISKLSLTVSVEVNDLDKLYGSVTELDIMKALEIEGYQIEKKDILLEKPIEELGIYEVGIKLHSEVKSTVRVWVTKK